MSDHGGYRSVGGGIYALLVFGILLIAMPIAAGILGYGHRVGSFATGVLLLSGVLFSVLATALIVIAKLYVRTRANEAIVRTGSGGMRVIQDGGAIVIPMIHEIVRVSLETMALSVKREGGEGALITRDKLRADIEAQFYLKVKALADDIKAAARSLGSRMGNTEAVSSLIEDKLISALRNAASLRTLEELNSDRESFTRAVEAAIQEDLAHNGLTLESVTISKLDQTDPETLRENNIFDAQGLRTIAEITQRALTERNKLTKEGEQVREMQNVDTRKQLLALQQQQAQAEAEQATEIAQIQAEASRSAREKQIDAERAVQVAQESQKRQVQVAIQEREQAVQIATQAKEKATQIAQQDRERAVEVAMREKLAAIADAEKTKALKEAEQNDAEAERERARQSITTVQAQAEAERKRTVEVVQAEAAAKKKQIEAEQSANAAAYTIEKQAEAQRISATAQAEATQKNAEAAAAAEIAKATAAAQASYARAEAEARGKTAIAAATRAESMIPVDVAAAQVVVEQKRVEVLQQELAARESHGKVGQEFELAQLRITKEAEVRIAASHAMASIQGKIEATVVSTAEDVAVMNRRMMQGMGIARFAEGFLDTADDGLLAGGREIAQELLAYLRARQENEPAKG